MSDQQTDEIVVGYKIVEIKNGVPLALFHGTNKRKKIKVGVWYPAEIKIVTDGSKGKPYISGWHFLKTKEECQWLLDNVFRNKENRYILKCFFSGDIRLKHDKIIKTKKVEYYLANNIFIFGGDVDDLLY